MVKPRRHPAALLVNVFRLCRLTKSNRIGLNIVIDAESLPGVRERYWVYKGRHCKTVGSRVSGLRTGSVNFNGHPCTCWIVSSRKV